MTRKKWQLQTNSEGEKAYLPAVTRPKQILFNFYDKPLKRKIPSLLIKRQGIGTASATSTCSAAGTPNHISVSTAGDSTAIALTLPTLTNLVTWWQFSDTSKVFQDSARTTVANVGDPVGGVTDSGPGNNHAAQTTANSRPTLVNVSNGGYSFKAIDCDGTDDWLTKTFTLNQPAYIAIVFRQVEVHGSQVFFDGGIALRCMGFSTGPEQMTLYLDGGGPLVTIKESDWMLVEVIANGSSTIARVNAAPTTFTGGGGNTTTIGGLSVGAQPGGVLPAEAQYTDIIACSSTPTDAQLKTMRDYMQTRYGIAYQKFLVCDGNSMTQVGATGAGDSYPSKVATSIGSTWVVYNFGLSGQTTLDMTSDAATQIDVKIGEIATRPKYVLVAWEIGNDCLLNSATAAAAYANFKTYCAARKTAGWTVIAMTETLRTGAFAPADTTAIPGANALLLADFPTTTAATNVFSPGVGITYANYLIDLTADSRLNNPADTTYFTDGTHMTDAGYTIVASYVTSAINLV